jgi:hypothetical protein
MGIELNDERRALTGEREREREKERKGGIREGCREGDVIRNYSKLLVQGARSQAPHHHTQI